MSGEVREPGGSNGSAMPPVRRPREDHLRRLRAALIVREEEMKRGYVPFSERSETVLRRLVVERDLGRLLAETVARGGVGSRSPGVTSNRGGSSRTLPEGISKQAALRFRQLAAIADDVFADYLEQCTQADQLPSAAGLRRHAGLLPRQVPRERTVPGAHAPPAQLVELACRTMDPIHVLIGEVEVACAKALTGDAWRSGDLLGSVFACSRLSDDQWRMLRRAGSRVNEVLVLSEEAMSGTNLVAALRAGWLAAAFPDFGGWTMAYCGAARRAFQLNCDRVGITISACGR